MKLRELPIVATVVVLVAVLAMIALGFWQLDRLGQKEALLARYGSVVDDGTSVPYPQSAAALEADLYRRSSFDCTSVLGIRSVSGTALKGGKGWAHIANCALPSGGKGEVALGWSRDPKPPQYAGGAVTGIIAPGGRIVADPPLAGLAALARPDPADIPNNHLAYAGQWFFFALTALVIYFLALKRRSRKSRP